MEKIKYQKAKGCCKFDCDDYPEINVEESLRKKNLEITTNIVACSRCKHFKPFDLYLNGKLEFEFYEEELKDFGKNKDLL